MKDLKLASVTSYSLAGILLLAHATLVHAAAVVILPNKIAPQRNVPSIETAQTDGNEMAGMAVTAFFSDGTQETATWQDDGGVAGSAQGVLKDWSLEESGDTYNQPWTLTYGGGSGLLTGFRIDGFAAGSGEIGVMFDRTFDMSGDTFGTPNSLRGRDFEWFGAMPPFDAVVRYEEAVGVGGNAPFEDEFRWLDVRFRDLNFGGNPSETLTIPFPPAGLDGDITRTVQFRQDTNSPRIPEPASATLLAVALGCLGAAIPLCKQKFDGA